MYPMEGDQAGDCREKLLFPGNTGDCDGPPLAWVSEWRGRYSNTYGHVILRILKEWGQTGSAL
jgi:hypothetical protein